MQAINKDKETGFTGTYFPKAMPNFCALNAKFFFAFINNFYNSYPGYILLCCEFNIFNYRITCNKEF